MAFRMGGYIRRLGQLAGQDNIDQPFTMAFATTSTATIYDLTAGGGRATATHGFGVIPTLMDVRLYCIQADNGFVASDEIPYNLDADESGGGTKHGGMANADQNNIYFQYENNAPAAVDTAGNRVILTATNWRIIFRCWA